MILLYQRITPISWFGMVDVWCLMLVILPPVAVQALLTENPQLQLPPLPPKVAEETCCEIVGRLFF